MEKVSRAALAALTAAMALITPAAAIGATTTTSVSLGAGSLLFSTAPQADPFGAAAITGRMQTLRTTFHDWGVTDARGTGAGWNVTMQATQLDDGAGHTLPAGSLVLTAPASVLPVGTNLALPPLIQGVSMTLDGAQPVKVLSAASLTGQGDWTVTQANLLGGDLVLTIPADAHAGTYTTTITSTLATGP
jgi:WxL domain surface cell wall-binding